MRKTGLIKFWTQRVTKCLLEDDLSYICYRSLLRASLRSRSLFPLYKVWSLYADNKEGYYYLGFLWLKMMGWNYMTSWDRHRMNGRAVLKDPFACSLLNSPPVTVLKLTDLLFLLRRLFVGRCFIIWSAQTTEMITLALGEACDIPQNMSSYNPPHNGEINTQHDSSSKT